VRKQLAEQGYEPTGIVSEQFADYIKSEIAKWTRVIKAAGLKAQ
jgi:tripartite-type tricarboxylate transporter receptor subunit TctC